MIDRNMLVRAGLTLLVATVLSACAEASGPQASFPDRLEVLNSGELIGEPGFSLGEPLAVRVVDTQGRGVPGQTVSFRVLAGGGTVTPASALTDTSGTARASWLLGPTPGENEVIAEGPAGLKSVTFRATARQSPGTRIESVSGGGTALLPGGCPLPEPLVIRVTNDAGQPVRGASVEFTADAGDGVVVPQVVQTGDDGRASAVWRLGESGGANRVRAVLRTTARPSVLFTGGNSVPVAPAGFATIGNTIFADCKPHLFHGVARPALQWSPGGDDRYVNIADDFALIKSWKANVVRIPITQIFWTVGTRQYDPTYKARVIDTVNKARAAGLAVIVDLHASDRGNVAYDTVPDVQQMADVKHSVPFWKDVANAFKHDGGVIFELYNEPNEISWDVWLNGGMIPEGPKYPGGPWAEAFQAAGMQQLYDAVRSTGARNLVIANGTHWGYFLDGVPTHRINGYNIVYGAHPYDWPDKQPDTWERAFAFLASTDPVILSEFGAYACSRLDYYEAALTLAEQKKMSWIAWAWWTPPPVSANFTADQRQQAICNFPALITDWNGTPSLSGALIKQRLASY